MDSTLTYTVKTGDGYIAIARFVFEQSPRAYIKTLAKRYDMLQEAASKIETDLKNTNIGFKLAVNQKITLHSDPGYYIPRLSVHGSHATLPQQAKKKAITSQQNDYYFVIHCTAGNMSESDIEDLKEDKPKGAGHAYITKEGDLVKIWPYNDVNGWATKVEKFKKKDLRGKFVNIELIYAVGDDPTEAQYKALADVYIEAQKLFTSTLQITGHREIDRGIPAGHEDPTDFKFEHFYDILRNKGVKIDSIPKQHQNRFDRKPWCQHAWVWPPVLTDEVPMSLSREKQIEKGCKVNP